MVFFVKHKLKLTLAMVALLSIGICLVIILMGDNKISEDTEHLRTSKQFVDNPGALISSGVIFMLCFQTQFFFKYFLRPKFFPPLKCSSGDGMIGSSMSRREEHRKLACLDRLLIPIT